MTSVCQNTHEPGQWRDVPILKSSISRVPYHYTPKQYFADHPEASEKNSDISPYISGQGGYKAYTRHIPESQPPKPPSTIDRDLMRQTMKGYDSNNFFLFIEPYELRHVVGGDDSRLLTLDNGDGIIGAGPQLMLSEKTLSEIEVGQPHHRMNPAYMVERFLDTMPGFPIVEHDFSGADFSVDIGLPEHT